MAPSKLRKAIGAVKDQTSISLAKVGSSASLSDLDVAIVKATRHEEYPPEERHIREILSLTCYSRVHVASCVNTISRRLSKTKNWVVALKSLMLIQRLLAEGDPAYEREIFFATCRGTRLLNMSDFRDTSKSNSWDYSAFVRTYALYLDEQLEFGIQQRRGKQSTYAYREEEDEDEEMGSKAMVVKGTPVKEMSNEQVFSRAHHLIQLLERFLACRPTGYARHNRVISIALYPIVKESFQLYYDITEILEIFIDRFMGLDVPTSAKVHDLFCRISKQYDDLDSFYTWCNTAGIARSSEYPDVEKIPQKKLDVMDEFIKEKSLMSQNCRAIEANPEPVEQEETKPEDDDQDDANAIKALPPPPEGLVNELVEQEETKGETEVPKEEVVTNNTQDVGDLLNLGEDTEINTQKQENALELALFDGNLSTSSPLTSTISPWEAFKDSADNWETALVQSASHLSNQTANLPGGFDTLMLDGMYKQGEIALEAASSGLLTTGSASSVAIGSAGRPSMLALPAPPSAEGGPASSSANTDPFAASLVVAPPPYVQMSEMEKKQRLLVEEQVAWQQYARDGMQGQVGLANVRYQNTYPYNYAGGYHQTY